MKMCFSIPCGPIRIAIADLTEMGKHRVMLNRINVPKAYRGQGIGGSLLRQVTDEADKNQITIVLGVSPSDGLTAEELEVWYHRHGFTKVTDAECDASGFVSKGMLIRSPQTSNSRS